MTRFRSILARGLAAGLGLGLLTTWVLAQDVEKGTPEPAPTERLRDAPERLDPREGSLGRRLVLPAFTDVEGKAGTVADAMGEKGLVILTRTTTCPVCKRYTPRLNELTKDLAKRGFGLLIVNPATHEDVATIRADVKKHGLTARHVHDGKHELARALGLRTTTEVFVLDRALTLVYRGALDDQFGLGYARSAPSRTYLLDAVDAVARDAAPAVAHTTAPGCKLKLSPAEGDAPETAAVTYHNRIARLLDRSCVECHRDGENGPFALDTYADAKGNAGMIEEMVSRKLMPPWFAADGTGPWANDKSLSDDDRQALLDWIAADCPEGDPKHAGVPLKRAPGWKIGKPDLVVAPPRSFKVPAQGVLRYRNVTVPTDFAEDRWITAMEIRPSAPQVVHHVLVFLRYPEGHPKYVRRPRDLEGLAGYFAGMVPGQGHVIYPEGLAKRLPAGAHLRFQIHYTPNGEAVEDRPSLGLVFADGPPEREVFTRGVFNARFEIPPGADHHEVQGAWMFPKRAEILAFMPHMHLRGKAARFEITPPGGEPEVLLDVPRYDFNWQLQYWLREPVTVEKRTLVRATGWFDNSAKNPANPDPKKAVRFGNQTFDEMMIGYVEWVEAE